MTAVASVREIYGSLATGGRKTRGADATTLGDEWLAPAIANGLIRPIPGAEASRVVREPVAGVAGAGAARRDARGG